MPEILSLALFERSSRVLVVRRKPQRPPFAGQWLLPAEAVGAGEAAEEALGRHAFHELNVEVSEQEFVETLYLEDEATGTRYVANVFRVVRFQRELRFRAAGDYEDARWLNSAELADTAMPASLRDWLCAGGRKAPQVRPVPVATAAEAPDNRAAWNAVSGAYQERYRLPTDRLVYGGHTPDESELRLLGGVAGLRVIVLGCGGGQDCIVLAKQGAQVTGIDLSDQQIKYGRRLAEDEGALVTLLQGNVEDLAGIGDESHDLAVSVHALNYVEHASRAFAEAHRVLRPGSPFVFSVHHPFDACLEDAPPFAVAKSYWEPELDWQWDFPEKAVSARMRSWYRPVSEWFRLATDAGFRVERLLEPPSVKGASEPWQQLGGAPEQKRELVPETLIMKVVKP